MCLWIWVQKVKGQGYNALITENGLCRIIAFPLHLSSWNFIQGLPMSRGYALLVSDQKVKGQGHNALITENRSWWYALWMLGSKGQGHNVLIKENGLCRIVAFPLHLSSWNFIQRLPMSWGCALWIWRSKGERPRSQFIVYWKWFMSHIIAFSLYLSSWNFIQRPHELRMCLMDFGFKR